jgi:hypothetical protein
MIPVQGSTAGLLYLAYVGAAATPVKAGHEPAADDAVKTATPEDLARIRTAGFVARPTACFTGARISVPLREAGPFLGCITMRCRAENIEVMSEVHSWVQLLRRLADEIAGGIGPSTAQ